MYSTLSRGSSWSASSIARSVIHFATPSPFHKNQHVARSRPLNPMIAAQRASTNCLDGLRGLAAFAVMIFHFTKPIYPTLQQGYGYIQKDGSTNRHILSLPWVKVWYSGGFMVFLFFVISGYVLSVGIIRKMEQNQRHKILPTLSSLAFRRTGRLFVPSLVASFTSYLLHMMGVQGQPEGHTPGFYNDTIFYLREVKRTFTFYEWSTDGRMWHLAPLWTIPVEFRCSMVLFLVLLALARCKRMPRYCVEAAMLLDCWIKERWDVGCFMLGLIVAEAHVRSQESDPNFGNESLVSMADLEEPLSEKATGSLEGDKKWKKYALWMTFIVGMYLGSTPTVGTCDTPWIAPLCALTFQKQPWQYIMLPAAFMVVFSILFLPALQRPLVSAPVQYLGKISYAMYLMHELVVKVLRGYIKRSMWSLTGEAGFGYHVGYVLNIFVDVAISLWIADMFMRAVDIPATNFTRWMEAQCIEKEDSSIPIHTQPPP